MSSRRIFTLLTTLAILPAAVGHAQIPNTPVGRQLSEWLRVQDTLDRATIQEFIETSMPFADADRMLATRKQNGGYEIRRVESAIETRIVVLAQARATHLFVRITLSVFPTEPHRIRDITTFQVEPPADLAPRPGR